MGSCAGQIVSMASGVIGLILVTVCCALTNWMTLYDPDEAIQIQIGLWKVCVTGTPYCFDTYHDVPGVYAIKAMTVISCLLIYLSFITLVILGFSASISIAFLQNEDNKPKIRLGVGVGLLLAGILLIVSVSWFPYIITPFYNRFGPGVDSIEANRGAGIYVGYVAAVLQLFDGGLLCIFRESIP